MTLQGAGGWPTIRYYNKATGYGGGAYTQKTGQAMCSGISHQLNLGLVLLEMAATARVFCVRIHSTRVGVPARRPYAAHTRTVTFGNGC